MILSKLVETDTTLVKYIRTIPNVQQGKALVIGGAARRVFENGEIERPNSDVDVFPKRTGWDRFFEIKKPRATKYFAPLEFNGWTICTTFVDRFLDDSNIFAGIDFTVCCFATDGHKIWYTDQARKDLRDRVLRMSDDDLVIDPKRILKYAYRDFTPAPGLVEKAMLPIIKNIDEKYRVPFLYSHY